MNDPIRDDEALFRVFDYARNHPDNWDQRHWRINNTPCGTTYCIAGFQTWVMDQKEVVTFRDINGPGFSNASSGLVRDGDDFIGAEDYAKKSLGLNDDEAAALFYCMENDDVEGVVKDIMNNKYREK